MAAWGQGQEAPTAPTRAEVMAAYGEKGEAVWREVEAGRQYGVDMQAIGTMTSEQQRQLLEERKPVPGEGYADAMKRYALLEEAVQKDNELRQEDPGAYLVLRDAGVKSALDAFNKASTPVRPCSRRARRKPWPGASSEVRTPQASLPGFSRPSARIGPPWNARSCRATSCPAPCG